MNTKEYPSACYLQSKCIEIKISLYEKPVRLDSPAEACACIGKIREVYKLPCEINYNSLQENVSELKRLIKNKPVPTDKIEKMCQILFAFSKDCSIEDIHKDIIEYAYENEK